MDELLIDEKKYVSSKQAAKMTGYAKDYIGQLCREGRVPARLVGRSWYVLETAIQDHRFGIPSISSKKEDVSRRSVPKTLPWTQEAPRYEASPVELIPALNKVKEPEVEPVEQDVASEGPESLQNAWRSWFERIGDTITSVADNKSDLEPEIEPEQPLEHEIDQPQEPEEESAPVAATYHDEEQEVNIPIHTIYRMPPRELLPNYVQDEIIEPKNREERPARASKSRRTRNTASAKAIRIAAIIIGITFASVAVISSGYLDNFLSSVSPISIISGESTYNK